MVVQLNDILIEFMGKIRERKGGKRMTHTWKWFKVIGGFVIGFILIILAIYGYRYQWIFKTDEFVIAATAAIVATVVCIAIFGIATLISHLCNRSNRAN